MADKLPNVVELNVGGQLFTTRLATLTSDPDSMLAAMFSGRHLLDKDSQGRFLIDREGALFRHVLNFLRDGSVPAVEVRPAVLKEAQYFQLKALEEALQVSTGKMAEEKVRAHVLRIFPKYEEVKRRLVSCAVAKVSKSHSVVDGDATFLVWEDLLSWKHLRLKVGTTTDTYSGSTHSVQSWFDRPDVVNLGLSDFGLDESEVQVIIRRGLDTFVASVSAWMATDLLNEGFKVTIFQNGAGLRYGYYRCSQKNYVCLTEVNFKFTFLPLPLANVHRDKF